jgi:hypothetical protein
VAAALRRKTDPGFMKLSSVACFKQSDRFRSPRGMQSILAVGDGGGPGVALAGAHLDKEWPHNHTD